MFIWALPRTSHWTATACEDAGFEIRDVVTHVFGSGFPKSLNIGKAIDKKLGMEREILGKKYSDRNVSSTFIEYRNEAFITTPASEEAKLWEGWGTGLKPASEHWILCRKPLSEKTIADNVLKWGVGGINIDKSRIEFQSEEDKENAKPLGKTLKHTGWDKEKWLEETKEPNEQGRFPANLIHDGSDEVMEEFAKAGNRKSSPYPEHKLNKTSESYNWNQSENVMKEGGYNDEGSAARFFYCSKASGKEKNEGLDDFEEKPSELNSGGIGRKISVEKRIESNGKNVPTSKNNHPTIKPIKLMSYLINMITPPNGIVLDPFMGSGSTGVAAVSNSFHFIGIEQNAEYMEIAKARINYKNK